MVFGAGTNYSTFNRAEKTRKQQQRKKKHTQNPLLCPTQWKMPCTCILFSCCSSLFVFLLLLLLLVLSFRRSYLPKRIFWVIARTSIIPIGAWCFNATNSRYIHHYIIGHQLNTNNICLLSYTDQNERKPIITHAHTYQMNHINGTVRRFRTF